MRDDEPYQAVCWEGDWQRLPRACGGLIETWDQTIGCTECGMNLWYLPRRDQWPDWDAENAPAADHWEAWRRDTDAFNPYSVFMDLFTKIHPHWSDDCHDPGDEDRSESNLWTIGP